MNHSKFTTMIFLITLIIFSTSLFAQKNKEFEKTLPFNQTGTVSINTYKGSITVETWDKDEVYFYAKVEPDDGGWNSTSPEEQLERCEVDFDHTNNYLSLESRYQKNYGIGSQTNALVHYTIKMPKTAKLRIDDYKSKTTISDLNSSVDIETFKGRIKLNNYSGDLDIETYKGDVDVNFSKLSGNCKFDTYKGDIILKLSPDSKFDFDFELGKKGDFSSDFDMRMTNYKSDDGDLNGSVNGGGKRIEFSTYKGEIELKEK